MSAGGRARAALPVALLALGLFAVTELPYVAGRLACAARDCVLNGPLIWEADQNMYFSFIRQAADGHLLFLNRLTHLPHSAVFFNPQWLLVGWIQHACGDSPQWAYAIWRALGVLALAGGIVTLTRVALATRFQRGAAQAMFLFGGGFGWLFLALGRAGALQPTPWMTLDTWTGTHPFAQAMLNPHFSLPHGLFLLFWAAYLVAERDGRAGWYWVAAALAALEGAARPYDLIALSAILPLFLLLEAVHSRSFSTRQTLLRLLPLLATAPLTAYYSLLFYRHDVFRYWASQGEMPSLPLLWQLVSLGPPLLLLVARLLFLRAQPLTRVERLLACWIVAVLLLVHAYKLPLLGFAPFSPQIGSTLLAPTVLLAVPFLDRARQRLDARRARAGSALAWCIVALGCFTSVYLVRHFVHEAATNATYRITREQRAAWDWLDRHAGESDVVFCTTADGALLAKYASVRVVAGHWSVTPHSGSVEALARQLLSGALDPARTAEVLRETGARWIYLSGESPAWKATAARLPGWEKRYGRGGVAIYGRGS